MRKNCVKSTCVIITILLMLGWATTAQSKQLTLNEVLEGSCRISVANGIGSGTCIAKDGENYIFLTNGHVVEKYTTAYVEIFRYGIKSYKIPATVVKTFWQERTDKDFALVAVNEKYVSQYPPRIIPLLAPGIDTPLGYTYSAGCPEGKWLCGWEGRIEEKQPTRLIFTPPPVGGQSGSSLLVNIRDENGELQTRVGALITFRIGDNGIFSDRRDQNGFELAKGVALPISTLYKVMGYNNTTHTPTLFPKHYIPTQSNIICKYCQRAHTQNPEDYAVDENGKYYCVLFADGKMSCRVEPGVKIIRWPRCGPDGCPQPNQPINPNNGIVPPFNNPNNNPNGNPFGNNLPNILPPDFPTPEQGPDSEVLIQRITELDAQIQTLQDQIITLNKDLLDSHNEGAQLSQEVIQKTNEFDNLNKTYIQMLEEKQLLRQELTIKENELLQKKTDLEIKEEEVAIVVQEKTNLEEVVAKTEDKTEELTTQRTWLGWLSGLLGVGFFSSIIWMMWNNFGRAKAKTLVDNTQDMVDDRLDDYLGPELVDQLHKMVDGLQESASIAIDDAIKSKLPALVEKMVEKKTIDMPNDNLVGNNVNSNVNGDGNKNTTKEKPTDNSDPNPFADPNNLENTKKTVDPSGNPTYNKIGQGTDPVSINVTNNNTNINTPQEDYLVNYAYIKSLFTHKSQDGERIEDWALRGILYKEAIEELKKGKLYYKGKTRLQGQAETARQINEWVREEFLKRMTKRDIFSKDELYREAMLGFLYSEAVEKLSTGHFSVLGHQATATAIRNWVNAEFLRRINVTI